MEIFAWEHSRRCAELVPWREGTSFRERSQDNIGVISVHVQGLPRDQCVFIRGFRVTRVFGILPRRLRGAAGPSDLSLDEDDESDKQLISTDSTIKENVNFSG